ncbi:hypothetical protein IJ182_00535 [bacterium]|nr:hypothetical protein [bacterium]
MAEEVKKANLYKNILGDAKSTIDAIQKFIAENSPKNNVNSDREEQPAASINKILDSIADEETSEDIQKIIDRL